MAQRRQTVRKIKEIIRLKMNGLSNEQTAASLKISKGTVHNIFKRFKDANLIWPLKEELSDTQWYDKLYPNTGSGLETTALDWTYYETELAKPGVTIQLLFEEYIKDNPSSALGRSMFYDKFRTWRKKKNCSMPVIHKGGDKLQVDYSGDSIYYADKSTGELIKTELFVASWAASSYTYAEVTYSQNKEDWVSSHVRAFKYFGVLPHAVVPDNLKSAVLKPSLYEPELNPLYSDMAEFYNIAILPARVRKPQDKGGVESNVLCVQRRIIAALRKRKFFTIIEINEAIHELLGDFNSRPMKDYDNQTRQQRFELLDQSNALPLPNQPFRITAIKTGVRINKNYHIEYEKFHYSCPYSLVGERVEVHQVGMILEIYHDGKHVCRHQKQTGKFGYETKDEHMPSNHLHVKGWSSSWFIFKGGEIGISVAKIMRHILEKPRHPEQAYKSCLGLISLAKKLDNQRLEKACTRALHFESFSYKAVKSILDKNLEGEPIENEELCETSISHDNIRGEEYYSSNKQAQGGM